MSAFMMERFVVSAFMMERLCCVSLYDGVDVLIYDGGDESKGECCTAHP